MIDLELFLRVLQSCLEDRIVKRLIFTVCTALLTGIGIQIFMTDTRIERLLAQELMLALIILLLFIVTKPRKPSNPQHPLPSQEPAHLLRRVKSRRIRDEGAARF